MALSRLSLPSCRQVPRWGAQAGRCRALGGTALPAVPWSKGHLDTRHALTDERRFGELCRLQRWHLTPLTCNGKRTRLLCAWHLVLLRGGG